MLDTTPLSPRQTFEDNMRPAHLLLRVFRLLDSNDDIRTSGDMMNKLRLVVQAAEDEVLLLIYNELFLGLVRERADINSSHLLQRSLGHLLRQAIVVSATALETFLPALLRVNLPVVVRAKQRDILPANDSNIKEFFNNLTFSLEDTLRLLNDPIAPEYIAEKMLGYINHNYLGGCKGIHVTGAILGLARPWDDIAFHLQRNKKDLKDNLGKVTDRRHDIVHRADRAKRDPSGEQQEITYAQTKQQVDTVYHVCLALNELVAKRIAELVNAHVDFENTDDNG